MTKSLLRCIQPFRPEIAKHIWVSYLRLSLENLQLNRSGNQVACGGENKAQLESDITTVRCLTSVKSNRSDEPDLAHTGDHTGDTAAEREHGGDTRRKSLGLIVEICVVALETSLEDEMIGKCDTLVNGKL